MPCPPQWPHVRLIGAEAALALPHLLFGQLHRQRVAQGWAFVALSPALLAAGY